MKNFSAFPARKMNVRPAGIAVKKLIKRFPRAAFAVSLDFSLGFKLGKIPVNRAFADFLSAKSLLNLPRRKHFVRIFAQK